MIKSTGRRIGGDCNSKPFSSKVSLGKRYLNTDLRNGGGQSTVQQHGVGSLGEWKKVWLGAVGLGSFDTGSAFILDEEVDLN